MAALDDAIAALTAQVESDTAVESSAVTVINGIAGQVAAAVAAAQAAGATPAQLDALNKLVPTLKNSADTLAAAIAANTSPATARKDPNKRP